MADYAALVRPTLLLYWPSHPANSPRIRLRRRTPLDFVLRKNVIVVPRLLPVCYQVQRSDNKLILGWGAGEIILLWLDWAGLV